MVVTCEVKFDNNPNAIFYAGQTLSGVVELTLNKPKKIRGLVLKIEGYTKVRWTNVEKPISRQNQIQNSATISRRSKIEYSGREDYISSTSYLIGSLEGNHIELAPGQYRYDFQSLLPSQLPTSCESNFGSIRYLVNVILDRPPKQDLTYKTAFTVIKQLDLNYETPSLKVPIKMDISKTYCCWICKSDPIELCASISQTGFVPGEDINIFIEVKNNSRFDVIDVVVSLLKHVKYNSQIPKIETKEELLTQKEVRYGIIKSKAQKAFLQSFNVPPLPPSNSSYCRLLNISYEVEVRCVVVRSSRDPFVRLPILIGTVPLNIQRSPVAATAPRVSPQSESIQSGYETLVNSFMMASRYPNKNVEELPPSYADAVYMLEQGQERGIQLNEENEHSMGSRPYNPMYPFYSFNHSEAQTPSRINDFENLGPPGSVSDSAIIHKY